MLFYLVCPCVVHLLIRCDVHDISYMDRWISYYVFLSLLHFVVLVVVVVVVVVVAAGIDADTGDGDEEFTE